MGQALDVHPDRQGEGRRLFRQIDLHAGIRAFEFQGPFAAETAADPERVLNLPVEFRPGRRFIGEYIGVLFVLLEIVIGR